MLTLRHARNLASRLGPGLITGAADDDPSGLATYSQAGAQFGAGLLWTLALTTPLMISIQMVSARIGWFTGKGLAANMRRLLPGWMTASLILLLVFANTLNIAADIAAMGEALQLVVGGPEHGHALVFGALCAWLPLRLNYEAMVRVLKWLTLALLSYVAVVFMLHARQAALALRPLAGDFTFLLFALGIIGTGLLAVPVLAGSAGYAVADAFEWRSGFDHDVMESRGFFAVVAASTVIGTLIDFTSLDPIKALVWSAVVNGVIAVPIMAAMMWLGSRPEVLGDFTLSLWHRILGWIATAVMGAAVVAMVVAY